MCRACVEGGVIIIDSPGGCPGGGSSDSSCWSCCCCCGGVECSVVVVTVSDIVVAVSAVDTPVILCVYRVTGVDTSCVAPAVQGNSNSRWHAGLLPLLVSL
jgi:hypothetical protein